ncbi:uncharacterized protein LOC144354892, partial [Saccoglossus kowalevskii]
MSVKIALFLIRGLRPFVPNTVMQTGPPPPSLMGSSLGIREQVGCSQGRASGGSKGSASFCTEHSYADWTSSTLFDGKQSWNPRTSWLLPRACIRGLRPFVPNTVMQTGPPPPSLMGSSLGIREQVGCSQGRASGGTK